VKRRAWTYIRCVGCAVAAFALFSGLALAQTNPEQKSPQSTFQAADSQQSPEVTYRAYIDLVVIPVTVTDTLNRFVLGLQKEDFHLFEDGVEQNVAHFSGEDAPLSVGVLFDDSGSMAYKLPTSRDAVTQLLNTLTKDDEAFLIEFADIAKVSIGFTGHTEEIQSALKNAQAGGLTAMLDAIDTGLREMKKAKNSRKAIVVVSDGGDNRSHYTAAQIESLVGEGDLAK
jgi:Ca-activated chloride channel family protein